MVEFSNDLVPLNFCGGAALVASCLELRLAPFEIFNDFEDILMCFFNHLKVKP